MINVPFNSTRRWVLLLAVLGLSSVTAVACSIPVFRYGLERWQADPFDVYVLHRGALGAADKTAVDALTRIGFDGEAKANLLVQLVDLAGEQVEPAWQQIADRYPDAPLPLVVVRYPEVSPKWPDVWSGSLADAVKEIPESPARRELAKSLLAGQSAVWVFVESGQNAKDAPPLELLTKQLADLEKTLELPTPDPNDPRVLTDLPLAIKFSIVRVSQSDLREKFFVAQLLKSENDWPSSDEPLVFPVFGRGRALNGLFGKGITAENITDAAEFIVGPCGCEVKRQNPGFDLLVQADWDALINRDRLSLGLPELTGVPLVAPKPTAPATQADPSQGPTNPIAGSATSSGSDPRPAVVSDPPTQPNVNNPADKENQVEPIERAREEPIADNAILVRNMVIAVIGGIILVAALTVIFFRR